MAPKIKRPSDSVGNQKYEWLNCPKNMDECFYDLEFVKCEYNEEKRKYYVTFKILDTDTRLKKGSEVSYTLDPYQQFAETYFWNGVFYIYLVCRGREISKEAVEKLKPKCDAILAKLSAEDGPCVGGACSVRIRRFEKDGKDKTDWSWAPLSAE